MMTTSDCCSTSEEVEDVDPTTIAPPISVGQVTTALETVKQFFEGNSFPMASILFIREQLEHVHSIRERNKTQSLITDYFK
jgi:hypothetical protein